MINSNNLIKLIKDGFVLMDTSSIVNYFGEFFGWDILVQGISCSVLIFSGIYIVRSILQDERNNDSKGNNQVVNFIEIISFKKILNEARNPEIDHSSAFKLPQAAVVFVTILVISLLYVIGSFSNPIADHWMDNKYSNTLFRRVLWEKKQLDCWPVLNKNDCNQWDDGAEYDYKIKLKTFDIVFSDLKILGDYHLNSSSQDALKCSQIERLHGIKTDIYYAAKHHILNEKNWRGYLSATQRLINILQVVTLASQVLLSLLIFGLMILIVKTIKRYFKRRKESSSTEDSETVGRKLGPQFKVILGALFSSYILIILTYNAWLKNEFEICYKTYGVLKVMDPCKLQQNIFKDIINHYYDNKLIEGCGKINESTGKKNG